jgi:HlyD family type I secretion membrane fusion protein
MSLIERDSPTPLALNSDPFEQISVQAKPKWQRASVFGYTIIFLFFVVLGGWASLAPLSSAIMAPGVLMVDSQIKKIQHDEDGVISEIFVRDGDTVEKGQVLVRLDNTTVGAQVTLLSNKLIEEKIKNSRWQAELTGDTTIRLPEEIDQTTFDAETQTLFEEEQKLLAARRQSLDGLVNLQLSNMDQLEIQISAASEELVARRQQKVLIQKELEDVQILFDKGLERKSRLRGLERAQSNLDATMSRLTGQIARFQEQINNVQLQIINIQKRTESEALRQITEREATIRELEERLSVTRAREQKLEIKAPRSGRILNSTLSTVGGFIRRGEVIMKLVPDDDNFIVEAQIKQRDIDNLSNVTNVQVRLTSFNQRFTHPIAATLQSVSDAVVDQPGKLPYYRALIRLDKDSLEKIIPNAQLRSGMPALSMIGVGQQSLLFYIVEPLFLSFYMALREPS